MRMWGMRSRRTASETMEKEPVMSAWEAMIAARVESRTAKTRTCSGSIWKNGLRSAMAPSSAEPLLARIHAPWPR